jgi:hypothetical protein
VVEGERPLPPQRLPSRSEEDDEDKESFRLLRAFFDFFAFFFGTFDLDRFERDALLAGMAGLSFSLATPSESESDDIESDPTFATAAAADAPGALDDAAAAAEDVPGLTIPQHHTGLAPQETGRRLSGRRLLRRSPPAPVP